MNLRKSVSLLFACCSSLALTGAASASVSQVSCVPWQGDTAQRHTILSNSAALLTCVVKTTDTSPVYAKWDFGDLSASSVTTLSGKTKYNVSTTHTYTASTGTPIVAMLNVSNNATFSTDKSAPYRMQIQDNTLDSRINIAIDKGLWWLYTNAYSNNADYGSVSNYVSTYNSSPAMGWWEGYYFDSMGPATASAVQAFAINGHRADGVAADNPYVEAVIYGMNLLVNGYGHANNTCPHLNAVAISTTPNGGNPDPNGNGYGIQGYDCRDHQPYWTGQVMDAIVASGYKPTDLTGRDFAPGSGASHNWTYGELLQDMADMHAWGQYDGGGCNGGICGSWWYNWNYGFPGDNSASQWGAIGMLPAQVAPWSITVPQWVKDYNANWLAYSMGCTGPSSAVTACTYNFFSYNGVGGCAGDSCQQTTTSGMVQMIMDGQTTSDLKWQKGAKKIADEWLNFTHYGSNWGNPKTYGWYSFAKAMRLSKPSATGSLVKTTGRSFDWYYGNPDPAYQVCGSEANCEKGLAQRILEIQNTSSGAWESGNLTSAPLTTAWMIITLRPTLFGASPTACFSANPNPSYSGGMISFDPACSKPSDSGNTLTNFYWDWGDGSTTSAATQTVQQHPYTCTTLPTPCAYTVTLQVKEGPSGATSTTQTVVQITNPPHPPVANAGGPYVASMCANDKLALDGSASFTPDASYGVTLTAYDWDLATPVIFDTINKTGVKPTLNGGEIASFFGTAGNHSIGLRVTDNAFAIFGSPNQTNANFATVDVKAACACNLVGRAKAGKIALTWAAAAGATSYDVMRSTAGPNTGFVKIASTTGTSYLDTTVAGTQYYYRVIANTGCSSGAIAAKGL